MTNASTPENAPEPTTNSPPPKRASGAGLGPFVGILVLVVVLVVGGLGVYVALPNSTSPGTSPPPVTRSTTTRSSICTNSTGGFCGGPCLGIQCGPSPPITRLTDAILSSPLSEAQVGSPVAFTATLTSATPEIGNAYTFNFGDGTPPLQTPIATVDHTFHTAGQYYIFVEIIDTTGALHDNAEDLLPFTVSASYANDVLGNYVQDDGSASSAIVAPGSSATFSAWIQTNVSNVATEVDPAGSPAVFSVPAVDAPDLSISWNGAAGWNAQVPAVATVSVSSSTPVGIYPVTYSIPSVLQGTSAWSNYTFTLFVGSGQVHSVPPPVDPHPGALQVYEEAPGGAYSVDPPVDYESLGAEVIANVYQQLIYYNGSDIGPSANDYVPGAATCVPGSAECAALYGTDLAGSDLDPDGQNITFVINPSDTFYNPYNTPATTQTVWPTDMLFSTVRDCVLAGDLSGALGTETVESTPGWDLCQAILPNAYDSEWIDQCYPGNTAAMCSGGAVSSVAPNPNWDSGIHYPYNNTPSNILASVVVNSTTNCPQTSAGHFVGNGCITYHTALLTKATTAFILEDFADQLGQSILDCAWEVGQEGMSFPGWLTGGDAAGCAAPPATTPAPEAWDVDNQCFAFLDCVPQLNFKMVGSGPYYLQSFVVHQSYGLAVNPVWGDTQWQDGIGGCQGGWNEGCLPQLSQIQTKTVSTVWETTQGPGEAAYQAGTADFATIPATDTALLLKLEGQNLITAITAPTLNTFFTNYNLAYESGWAQRNIAPTGQNLTQVPWLLQDPNLRQFLNTAYPYGEVQQSDCTVDGLVSCEMYGGVIPQGEGNFYPTNISWPAGNPNLDESDVGGAAWWWAQTAADDQAGKVCTNANPCYIPFVSYAGDPFDDEINAQWITEIETISNDAIKPVYLNSIPFGQEVVYTEANSGDNPMQMYVLGWSPDYPDPANQVYPMYSPAGTYTTGDALYDAFEGDLANAPWAPTGSTHGYDATCAGTQWDPVVTLACQGSAYANMTVLLNLANNCVAPSCSEGQRALWYDMGENIANNLGLMQYRYQQVGLSTYASWIDGGLSFHPNPEVGNLWFEIQYVPGQ